MVVSQTKLSWNQTLEVVAGAVWIDGWIWAELDYFVFSTLTKALGTHNDGTIGLITPPPPPPTTNWYIQIQTQFNSEKSSDETELIFTEVLIWTAKQPWIKLCLHQDVTWFTVVLSSEALAATVSWWLQFLPFNCEQKKKKEKRKKEFATNELVRTDCFECRRPAHPLPCYLFNALPLSNSLRSFLDSKISILQAFHTACVVVWQCG